MAGGTSSSTMRDVERATTPLIKQIPKITLSNKEIEEVQKRFNNVIDTLTVDNKPSKLEEFNGILNDRKIEKMEAYYKQEEKDLQNVMAHLPDQKKFLTRFSLQEVLVKMLKDIAKYAEFLKLFIERFNAHKECIEAKHLLKNDNNTGNTMEERDKTKNQPQPKIINDPRTIRELDTPLHCAVRQLNEGFLEWLLKESKQVVDMRNKRRETALAILCQMYDWSKEITPKLKTRVDDIEKELQKADKKKKIMLNDEMEKVSAQIKELEEEEITMKGPTILNLIDILLKNDADFNIYMNDGALPFDFLRKYDTETDVVKIINSYTKSRVAMTEKPSKQSNNNDKGKNVSKKRIVKFYEKKDPPGKQEAGKQENQGKEAMNVSVTVELLEIFIWFQDLEKFNKYWKDFKVTGENVKKVITLLLHVAVERNYTPYVEHIIKKESEEIFKLEESKATDTQNPSAAGASFHKLDETSQLEENKTENSQDTSADTSKRISMNTGGSSKDNPSATEDAQPQTQSGTSKLQVTDPHMESGTSKLERTDLQTPRATTEFQDNNPDSQDNHVAMLEGTPTSHEQPSGWCCLKCFQKKQNPPLPDGTNLQAQSQNSKDCRSTKAEGMVHRNELRGLLKMVCLNGNILLLNMFLKKMNDRLLVNENPLLINTLNGAYTMKQKKKDFLLVECIKLLINNHSKVDMYRVDMNGNTALHLALSYGYENLALLMLKHAHGLMGRMNNQYFTPIEYGTKQFWDNYLNNCIIAGGRSELKFNLNFLQPPAKKESIESKTKESCWLSCLPWFKPMNDIHNSKYRFTRTVNDMTALCLISQSKDRKEFLMHPVINAFIIMKWERLCHWNILNLLLTTLTMGTFIGYTLMTCSSGGWKCFFTACVILGVFIISVREIMQMFLLRWSYVTVENIVDIINVVLIVKVLGCGCERDGWCEYGPIYSSFVVISLSLQATFLLGASWNSLSITLYMFKTVSISFFKSFLSFTPVIGAFIYSFYRTNNEPSDDSVTYYSKEDSQNKSSEKNFNSFPSFLNATIKTLVMTTGEFEAANIEFDGGKWLLFVAFVFVAPIVILNLINGLAVSDIAAIRQESEFISIYRKVKLIERYERAVINYGHKIPGYLQRFFRDPWFPGSFFQDHESIIYMKTRELNQLRIQQKKGISSEKPRPRLIPGVFVRLFKCMNDRYFGFRSYEKSLFATLDQSYVDKAMAIVNKRFTTSSDETTRPSTTDTRDTGNDTQSKQISKNNGVPAVLPPSKSEDQSGDQ